MSADYDVVLVGGGLAGASLACALSDTGLRIALVEAEAFDAPADANRRARTTALAWGTRTLFESLGVWDAMAGEAAPIAHLHVSQAGHLGRVVVEAGDYGLPALGYVVPNTAMISALRRRLDALPDVALIAPARFESLVVEDDRVTLRIAAEGDERVVTTRLLIGADGNRSAVRAALGIGARVDDYAQSAIITRAQPERPLDGWAYERFTPDGPVALLPCGAETAAVVWTVPQSHVDDLLTRDDAAFRDALQTAFGDRLGRLTVTGPRGAYPLKRLLADRVAVPRAALIGNAGVALHPAAAQGFNLAIRDALDLAATLREHQRLDADAFDPGALDTLEAWAERRRPDQHRVAGFTDRIVRVFSNRIPGLGHLRGAGLLGLSLWPGLRDDMARRSMGMALVPDGGRAPRVSA